MRTGLVAPIQRTENLQKYLTEIGLQKPLTEFFRNGIFSEFQRREFDMAATTAAQSPRSRMAGRGKAQEAKNAAAFERLTKEISKLTLQRVKLDSENRALSLSILACEEHLKKQVQQRPPMILPTWGKWSVATAILAIARHHDIFRRTSSEATFMATKKRFEIGDEVALRGIVRLLDVAGPGTVTIEIAATGQRLTVMSEIHRRRACRQG